MKTKFGLYICCFVCLLSFETFGQKRTTFLYEEDYLNGAVKNLTLKYFDASEKFGKTALNLRGEYNFTFTPDGRTNSKRIHDGKFHIEFKLTKDTLEVKEIKINKFEIADQSDSTISKNDQDTIDSLDTTSTEYLTKFVYRGRRVIEEKGFRDGSLTSLKVYKYDSNDRLIEDSKYNENGELESKYTKKFNSTGQIADSTIYIHGDTFTRYEKYQNHFAGKNITRSDQLDQANELVGSTEYKYNSLGNLVQEVSTHKDGDVYNTYYQYNSKNQLIEIKEDASEKYLYKYDTKGGKSEVTRYALIEGKWVVWNKHEYEYTSEGRVKTHKWYAFTDGKLESIYCTEKEFDKQGNWISKTSSSAHSPNLTPKTDEIEKRVIEYYLN